MGILRVTLFVLLSALSAQSDLPEFDWTYKDQSWNFEGATCTGDGQSPIALFESKAVKDYDKSNVQFNWETEEILGANLIITNQTVFVDGSRLTQTTVLNGVEYKVYGLDFHWGSNASKGSEHSVESNFYSGEVEVYNIKANLTFEDAWKHDGWIIVSILLEEDATKEKEDNDQWQKLVEEIPVIVEKGSYWDVSWVYNFNLKGVIPSDRQFFRYTGSFSAPGCEKKIERIVFKTPMKVSPAFFAALRTLNFPDGTPMQDTFRHIQDQGNRTVYKSFD